MASDLLDPTPAQANESRRTRRGIPPRYWPALDALEETPAVAAARKFMAPDDSRTFLVLAGAAGCGKTCAAAWAIDHHLGVAVPYLGPDGESLTAPGPDVFGLFVKVADLSANLFDADMWKAASSAPRLALDDLGLEASAGQGREHFLGRLVALLHNRYDHNRKTVITANLTREVFASTYLAHDGGRLADRFREVGWFQPVAGASRRRQLGG